MATFRVTTTEEKFQNDVLAILSRWEDDERRMNWKSGASVSYVMKLLKEDFHWIRLGKRHEFETALEEAGFTLTPGLLKNGQPNKNVYVVTL